MEVSRNLPASAGRRYLYTGILSEVSTADAGLLQRGPGLESRSDPRQASHTLAATHTLAAVPRATQARNAGRPPEGSSWRAHAPCAAPLSHA
eukprot:358368-Chlamydomonas_euryale.AAC.4